MVKAGVLKPLNEDEKGFKLNRGNNKDDSESDDD